MEMIIGAVSMTVLLAASFMAGVKFADTYATRRENAVDYALKRQYIRLKSGADADDPCQPYVSPDEESCGIRRYEVPQEFVQNMRECGQATMRVQ